MKVLCVTENEAFFERLRTEAYRLSWQVESASGLDEFRIHLSFFNPDVILADTNDRRIFEWWKSLRPSGQPLIFVQDSPDEMHAMLLRLERLKSNMFFPKYNLHIDSERQVARIGAIRLSLTLTELRLLRELVGMTIETVGRKELEKSIFGAQGAGRRSLDVHICSLRKKLKSAGLTIESIRGVGYRLNPCRNSA